LPEVNASTHVVGQPFPYFEFQGRDHASTSHNVR
jgi:hypothetical protein